MYEHPEVDFMDMAMRFMDIRKRVYTFPKMGEKAYFIAIPTSAGTGSEVTPFAVITDEKSGVKYPLADYELLPNMAVIDTDFHMSAPKGLTAASGIDAVTHALEAYAAMLATDYTDGLAKQALKMILLRLQSLSSSTSPELTRTVRATLKHVKRWQMQQQWQVWPLQTPSSEYVTPWLISSALSITSLTV